MPSSAEGRVFASTLDDICCQPWSDGVAGVAPYPWRVSRLRAPPPVDVAIAAVLAGLGLSELRWHWSGYYGGGPAWANVPLVLLTTLPLAWRRRAPLAVLGILVLTFLLPQALAHLAMSFWGDFIPYALALYSVSAHEPRPRDILALGGGIAAYALVYIGRPEFRRANEVAFDLLVLGVAWGAGQVVRRSGQLEVRNALLARASVAEAEAAVERERKRIARELHDVVAHNVSMMLVQTAAAKRLLTRDTDNALLLLDVVERAGREAVDEMQVLLGVLRVGDEAASLAPRPGMDRLDELIAQVREAGLNVTLRVEGEVRPLPAPLDMSAYRIVQEALTNAMKHAGTAHAEVRVRFSDQQIELDVRDNGRGSGHATHNGHGLLGIRERVLLYGGKFEAGPRPNGGFRVHAHLPIQTGAM
jgi:signal transduction histidine kinase